MVAGRSKVARFDPPPRPILAALFPDLTAAEFVRETYPNELLPPRESELVAQVRALDGLDSPEALFARLGAGPLGPASIALRTSHAHEKVILPSVALAREAFRSGHHLTFAGLEHLIPELRDCLTRLGRELAVPEGANPRTLLYLSPRGDAAGMHFDANVNFVLQLRGTKRWRYAPNRTVDVTRRHVVNTEGLERELRLYMDRAPSQAPRARRRFELRAGQAFFLPRSAWHATRAQSESMALNFVFAQPTWADFVLAGLRRRMLRDPEWRALQGAPRDPDLARREHAVEALGGLLSTLREELGGLSAQTLWRESRLGAGGLFVDDVFRRHPRVELAYAGQCLTVSEASGAVTQLELGGAFVPVIRFMVEAPACFSMDELIAASEGLALESLAHALEKLLDVGALERC